MRRNTLTLTLMITALLWSLLALAVGAMLAAAPMASDAATVEAQPAPTPETPPIDPMLAVAANGLLVYGATAMIGEKKMKSKRGKFFFSLLSSIIAPALATAFLPGYSLLQGLKIAAVGWAGAQGLHNATRTVRN